MSRNCVKIGYVRILRQFFVSIESNVNRIGGKFLVGRIRRASKNVLHHTTHTHINSIYYDSTYIFFNDGGIGQPGNTENDKPCA